MFIDPTLIFDFGAGITMNFRFLVELLGLLVIIFYHIFYRSTSAVTKLSLTCWLTLSWLSLIIFFPFNAVDIAGGASGAIGSGGAVAFFALLGGLAVCMLWIHFFSDEVPA